MLYFYSPAQIGAGEAPSGPGIRVGGMVVEGSVQRGDGTEVSFTLSDGAATVDVIYAGILPDLFREAQGIVASLWSRIHEAAGPVMWCPCPAPGACAAEFVAPGC